MQPNLLDEILFLVFHHVKKNPVLFVDFFDSSEIISAFIYDHDRKGFTQLSRTLKEKFNGDSNGCLPVKRMVKNYVHPNDKLICSRYFKRSPELMRGNKKSQMPEIQKMKCRLKKEEGHWKICTFYSFDCSVESESNYMKVGIIVQEHYKSGEKVFFLFKNKLLTLANSLEMGEGTSEYKIKDTEMTVISQRESEILELIGEGLITKQIAHRLNISPTTVITHRNNLMLKMGAKNTPEMINKANHMMLL